MFVVGAPRSGTTWVQYVLSKHPDMVTPPETHLFVALRDVASHVDATGPRSGLQHCVHDEQLTEWYGSLWSTIRTNLLDASPGSSRVLEKTPAHVGCIDLIRSAVPGARFVHVVRNPHDVVRSLLEASRGWGSTWAPGYVEGAVEIWLSSVQAWLETAPGDDLLSVRHEDLRHGPAEWAPVLDHLGIDSSWPLDHLGDRPGGGAHLARVSSAPDSLWDEVEGFSFHDRPAGSVRRLTGFEQRVVTTRCAELAERLGYDFSGLRRLTTFDRLRLHLRRARRGLALLWRHRSPTEAAT